MGIDIFAISSLGKEDLGNWRRGSYTREMGLAFALKKI